jgi:hypothetical protein
VPGLAPSAAGEPRVAQSEGSAGQRKPSAQQDSSPPRQVGAPPAATLTASASGRTHVVWREARSTARVTDTPGAVAIPALGDREVVAAVAATDDAGAIDKLSPLAPITIAAISPRGITPAEITISPLPPLADVHVAPLSPPDRRN